MNIVMSSQTDTPARAPASRWGNRILLVMAFSVVLPAGVSLLHFFPPTEFSLLPCWFHWLSLALLGKGLHCPGCGATRSVYALVHGDFPQALAYNPLFILLLPLILYGIGRLSYEMWTGKKASGPGISARGSWLLVSVLAIYWIVRNIDVYPMNLLAPHEI
jgi:hypothetical protein